MTRTVQNSACGEKMLLACLERILAIKEETSVHFAEVRCQRGLWQDHFQAFFQGTFYDFQC